MINSNYGFTLVWHMEGDTKTPNTRICSFSITYSHFSSFIDGTTLLCISYIVIIWALLFHTLRADACPLVTPLSGSDLRGHTLATHSADGLRGHVASEHRVDGVEEAGLPGTHRPHQQHSGLGHTAELRLVLLDLLHQFLFTPAERRSRNIHFVKGLSLRRRRRRWGRRVKTNNNL